MANRKVFVSGCYDLLHSGHVEFFRQASQYGDLYVGIGSDKTIEALKGHKTLYNERERLFMVRAIRYVKEAYINQGDGYLDFLPTLDLVQPDCLVVNEDGEKNPAKQKEAPKAAPVAEEAPVEEAPEAEEAEEEVAE